MAQDPQPLTLQQRIAALNAAHVGRIPGDPLRPSPSIPTRRPVVVKQKTFNNPPENVNGSVTDRTIGNQPAPPPPPPARKQPPPLPSRNNSLDEQRRGSVASTTSSGTNDTNLYKVSTTRTKSTDSANRIKAPAWGDCELPPLPARGSHPQPVTRKFSDDKPKYVNRAPSCTSVTTPASTRDVKPAPPPRPSLPPRLPSRKNDTENCENAAETPTYKLPPLPSADMIEKAKKAALSFNSQKEVAHVEVVPAQEPTILPARGHIPLAERDLVPREAKEPLPMPAGNEAARLHTHSHPAPPPVPLSSRPDLSAIQATKPRFAAASTSPATSSSSCLVCRDFSGPDHQATLFPRNQVASLQTLAHQLTSPFPSPTDKARAIFTWLHYNVAYDVVAFFGNNVKPSTPQSTLQSGLAVCEGYAALFTNIATYAGLESVVIGGHGKGYGFSALAPGAPLPSYNAGHAWNAVKVDNGEWKLIDCCWGAGYVQGAGRPYVAKFNPEFFSMTNEQFAVKHFPGNKDQFFLPGGRRMSWEEYIVIDPACWPDAVEGPTVFTNAKEDYSIGEKTFSPRARKIDIREQVLLRFQFSLVCPHWTLDRHTRKGPPPVFIVSVGGVDGRNKDLIPLEYYPGPSGQGGDTWIADIPAQELGAPGQTLTLFAVKSFGDRQDARGLTVQEFLTGKGRVGMGFVGVAAWDLV
ncbi:hypothetical protein PV05_00417 [Exophiala xenobiotica]|uniref:Transglutaminase-like domain-containing protein n=1 Tax=Exophiala xenobiotica TaxID=348802 RepID=A0A0D2EZR8_9EURO|nr:uncharacterized protein PV05_00417 [Exophiala xenobiotica]KIW60180.1 hypothetical protein PV05_00417 [Exophiala xenobiotica]